MTKVESSEEEDEEEDEELTEEEKGQFLLFFSNLNCFFILPIASGVGFMFN